MPRVDWSVGLCAKLFWERGFCEGLENCKGSILDATHGFVGSGFMGSFFSETIVLEEMIQEVIVEDNSLAETQRREALMRWGKQEIRKA